MSQVESRPQGGRPDFLLLAVLAEGVVLGAVRGGRPVEGAILHLPLDAQAPPEAPAANEARAPARRVEALRHALSALAGRASSQGHIQGHPMALRVCVSDTWLQALTLPWCDALRQPAGAQAFAKASLLEAGCEGEADDVIRLDDAPYQQPRLALQYPAALMAALREAATQLGADLVSVRPLSMAVSAAMASACDALGEPSAVCIVEDGAVSLALRQGHVRELLVRQPATSAMAEQLLARQQLRHASWQAVSHRVAVNLAVAHEADGLPAAWQPWTGMNEAVDASAGTPTTRLAGLLSQAACWRPMALDAMAGAPKPWRKALMAAVMLLWLLPLMWLWQGWSAQRQDDLQPLIAALPVPETLAAASPEALKRVKALNEAIDVLNTPVSRILQGLQPPKDIEVGILSLDFATDAASRQVRITAESPTSADMLRYVDYVAGKAPFEAARLIHHERVEGGAGQRLRYTMELTWRH